MNLGNIKADEIFIPIATDDYVVWGQKDVGAVNLYSCNVDTKVKVSDESFHIYGTYPAHMVSVSNGWLHILQIL
ncbi:MAG: hypothetical protein R2883_04695 [Caldisericia bacterium]